MKTSRHIVLITAWGMSMFAPSPQARAIPLPDTSSCNVSGGSCFQITNTSNTSAAIAIRGISTSDTGVVGQANGFGASGVQGVCSTGNCIGVRGSVSSSGNSGSAGIAGVNFLGVGVYGSSSGNNGVMGTSSSTTASGVYGENTSTAGYGVAGRVNSAGTGKAIYGDSGNSSSAWAGYFDGRVTAGSYFTISDMRRKKEIQSLSYGTTELSKLRPVQYQLTDKTNQERQLGLIAQEVQKVIPEVVSTDAETGLLAVNYQALIPIAIKTIQEQRIVIQQHEARLAALERAQSPALSQLAGGSATSLVLGLLPLGIIAAWQGRSRLSLGRKRLD